MKLLVDIRRPGLALLLSLGLAACGGESSTSGSTTQSAAPVVTFASQVEAGAEAYATNCAICHGANLEGSTLGPLLSGFSWVRRWGTQTPTLLLGNIQANMPPGGNEG
ncbi:MAG: cytochrome c, partial [Pseudohongiellaceae bacterium]